MFIEPGYSRENGCNGSLHGTLRRELLDREVFDRLLEAKVMIEKWRGEYNHKRPYGSPGFRMPAPVAIIPFEEAVEKMFFIGTLLKVESCRLY